jgi:hypothetical protein
MESDLAAASERVEVVTVEGGVGGRYAGSHGAHSLVGRIRFSHKLGSVGGGEGDVCEVGVVTLEGGPAGEHC